MRDCSWRVAEPLKWCMVCSLFTCFQCIQAHWTPEIPFVIVIISIFCRTNTPLFSCIFRLPSLTQRWCESFFSLRYTQQIASVYIYSLYKTVRRETHIEAEAQHKSVVSFAKKALAQAIVVWCCEKYRSAHRHSASNTT